MGPADRNRTSHLTPVIMGSTTPAPNTAGDPIPRIQCPTGYTATLYAEGLSSPDGLAFGPTAELYVAEERRGRVSRIESDGTVTPVLSDLDHPEGIAFDDTGNLYVVEDVEGGRLVKMAPDGMTTTLAAGLDAPEGVVWASDGTLFVTESNVQFMDSPFDLRTHITAISPDGEAAPLATTAFRSYAGITIGADGLLYVTNEASGTTPDHSIFTVDPATGMQKGLARDLTSPEGLRFTANGQFPLYVAEEDTGASTGRLTQIKADGSHTPFCTGFLKIEDVILDAKGRLYVSEDESGTIIVIESNAPQWQVRLPFITRRVDGR
jgi:sugar lactone lactonase YvrE